MKVRIEFRVIPSIPYFPFESFMMLSHWKSKAIIGLAAFASTLAIPSIACGQDVLQFRNNNKLAGKWLNAGSDHPAYYDFQLEDGTILSIEAKQVLRVVSASPEEKEFLDKVSPKLKEDDPKIYQAAIEWCSKRSLTALADAIRDRVLDFDPNNKQARAGLDYVGSEKDGWVRQERFYAALGMFRKKGGWKFPEDFALEEAEIKRKTEVAAAGKEFEMRWNELAKGINIDKATIYFQQIRSPLVTEKIRSIYTKGNLSSGQKSRLVEILDRIQGPSSIEVLAQIALFDSDTSIRDQALTSLERFGKELAAVNFENELKKFDGKTKSPEYVNRLGYALGRVGDRRSIPVLIDRLVTTHEAVTSTGGDTQAGFTNDGNGSFSAGNKSVKFRGDSQNRDVLSALTSLANENPGDFNQDKWRQWYAAKYAKTRLNLRRDL